MVQKAKDFYGKEVTTVIEDACRDFGVSQEELEIEVLETGSAGIFGLCKKKAHIRVRLKKNPQKEVSGPAGESGGTGQRKQEHSRKASEERQGPANAAGPDSSGKKGQVTSEPTEAPQKKEDGQTGAAHLPSREELAGVRADIKRLLELMGYPAEVHLEVEDGILQCRLSGAHEEALIGQDGRTLDSLQYLLRKMVSRWLPERMMLNLDVGDFRERRAEELRSRALELAAQVRENGKTQAIAALNPAERRIVHMVLQEDREIRSRSVGEGLFKKVLIYRPGKGQKSQGRRRRGRSGGRSSTE